MEVYAYHNGDPLTKKEYLGEMINCARFRFGSVSSNNVDVNSNYIMANEYAEFKEFMADRINNFDELFEEFIVKMGTDNINGYKEHGFLKDYNFPIVVSKQKK